MKLRIVALASTLALSLLTSTAWAARPGTPLATGAGLVPEVGGTLRGTCPADTTEFRDQFPNITNGPNGGTASNTYTLQGTEGPIDVTLTITWFGEGDSLPDNAFNFEVTNGFLHKILVKSADTLLYDYTPEKVTTDTGLNVRVRGAQDVSHLEFCLSPPIPDGEPPIVTITSPPAGTTVSGTVTVTATITDNVEVSSVTAGVGGVSLGTGTLSSQVPNQYEWEWNTAGFSTGSQTVTVSATDTSGNTTTMSVVVTVVISIASCEGLLGDEDQNPDQGEGCNPSGVQNVQVPLDNDSEDCQSNNPPEPCTITEFLLTPDPDPNPSLFIDPDVLDICTGPNVFPDPRVDANGFPQDVRPLYVFAELGGAPAQPAGLELVLDEFTYGNPCFAVVFGNRNFVLTEGFPTWPVDDSATPDVDEATGLVIIRTQFEELIPGIGPVTECYDEVDNPDLQEAGEFTYQMDFLSQMIAGTAEVMTNRCFNPKRASTRDLSFNVLNTKEHCGIEFLDPQGELIATAPADVVDCKFQLADAKFDALDLSIDFAAPDLVSPKLSDLTKKFNQARSQFNKKNSGSLARAIADLEDLLFEVKNGTWTVTNDNFPGDVQMRVENLIQRVTLLKRAVENPNFPVQ